MSRPGPEWIGTNGATDGYALLYNAATDEVEYGPHPSGG